MVGGDVEDGVVVGVEGDGAGGPGVAGSVEADDMVAFGF